MAKSPDGKSVHQGRIGDAQEVENTQPKFGSNDKYYAVRLQLPGNKEVTALFTMNQITEAINRATKNPEDIPEAGVIGRIIDKLD